MTIVPTVLTCIALKLLSASPSNIIPPNTSQDTVNISITNNCISSVNLDGNAVIFKSIDLKKRYIVAANYSTLNASATAPYSLANFTNNTGSNITNSVITQVGVNKPPLLLAKGKNVTLQFKIKLLGSPFDYMAANASIQMVNYADNEGTLSTSLGYSPFSPPIGLPITIRLKNSATKAETPITFTSWKTIIKTSSLPTGEYTIEDPPQINNGVSKSYPVLSLQNNTDDQANKNIIGIPHKLSILGGQTTQLEITYKTAILMSPVASVSFKVSGLTTTSNQTPIISLSNSYNTAFNHFPDILTNGYYTFDLPINNDTTVTATATGLVAYISPAVFRLPDQKTPILVEFSVPNPTPAFVFSPYKDVALNFNWNTNVISTAVSGTSQSLVAALPSTAKTLTLAFASGECGNEKWAGIDSIALAKANIQNFVSSGVKYVISTGGASGKFTCATTGGMNTFINRYSSKNLIGIDFDIETDQTTQDINNLVNRALEIQKNYPNLRISFTIASSGAVGSSTVSNLSEHGKTLMQALLMSANGTQLKNYYINLMVMDYGSVSNSVCAVVNGACDMNLSAQNAAKNLNSVYGVPLSQIELTPMIGNNDVLGEVFTVQNASDLASYVLKNKLGGLHYWSFDRDNSCANGAASATCSYAPDSRGTFGFLNTFTSALQGQPIQPPQPFKPTFLFSPYKDVTINYNWITNVLSTKVNTKTENDPVQPLLSTLPAKANTISLGFATGECGSETWGAIDSIAMAKVNVQNFSTANVNYIISTGGAAGKFTCSTAADMYTFINRYSSKNLIGIDFDIEAGQSQSDINNLVTRSLEIQKNYPNLRISFTLASSGGNNTYSNLNAYGTMLMQAIKDQGLTNYYINLMVMDYGSAQASNCAVVNGLCDMNLSAQNAAKNLNTIYSVPLNRIELTPMIGNNDVLNEIFTIQNAKDLAAYAVKNSLGGIHYWSFDRDKSCANGSASPTCSYAPDFNGSLGFLNAFLTVLKP